MKNLSPPRHVGSHQYTGHRLHKSSTASLSTFCSHSLHTCCHTEEQACRITDGYQKGSVHRNEATWHPPTHTKKEYMLLNRFHIWEAWHLHHPPSPLHQRHTYMLHALLVRYTENFHALMPCHSLPETGHELSYCRESWDSRGYAMFGSAFLCYIVSASRVSTALHRMAYRLVIAAFSFSFFPFPRSSSKERHVRTRNAY